MNHVIQPYGPGQVPQAVDRARTRNRPCGAWAAWMLPSQVLLFVPGLLQTEDYARAVIRGTLPHASPEQAENRVLARMERQALLTREAPPRLWAIMDEAAARRQVGGPQIMAAQLTRLRSAAALPNVTLQVIPFAAGAHPGMPGSFIVLDFADPADQNIVYIDSMAGDLFLEQETEISRYVVMFEHLRAAALRPDDSIALLAAIAEHP